MENHWQTHCFGVYRASRALRSGPTGCIPVAMTSSPRLDEAFDALSSVHRRRLLMDLRQGHVARLGRATQVVADGGSRDHETVEVDLYHRHLPKLARAGFVTWDREGGSIEQGPRFDEIEPMLGLLDENADRLPDAWV